MNKIRQEPTKRTRTYPKKTSRKKLTLMILTSIIIFNSFIVFIPHIFYPYPLHVDEWFHISVAKEILKDQSFPTSDPFTGGMWSGTLEKAWHFLLADFILIANPQITDFRFFIILFSSLAIVSTFIFVKQISNQNQALVSALLVGLIPSNVSTGGLSFLIPMNLGLIFIPLALTVAFKAK